MYEIEGKVALVTGGGHGIGRGYCIALAKRGAKVVIIDINESYGQEVANDINQHVAPNSAISIACDVTDRESLKSCFDVAREKFGKLDIVINNAAVGDDSANGWRRTVDVNLVAVIEGCKLAVEYLQRGGVIVNTSSRAANGDPTFMIHAATKAGVTTLSRSLGAPDPFEATGIRVMAVHPGRTYTNENMTPEQLLEIAWIRSPKLIASFIDQLAKAPGQSVECVADCLIDMLENGESGSVWTVVRGKWWEEKDTLQAI